MLSFFVIFVLLVFVEQNKFSFICSVLKNRESIMILLHQQSKYVVINLISCWWKSKVWNLKFIFVHTVNLVFLYKHDLGHNSVDTAEVI